MPRHLLLFKGKTTYCHQDRCPLVNPVSRCGKSWIIGTRQLYLVLEIAAEGFWWSVEGIDGTACAGVEKDTHL